MQGQYKRILEMRSDRELAYAKLVHDLKGPLNSIKGLLYIALRDVEHVDTQRYFNLIEHYQQLLYYRINELLNNVQVSEKNNTLDFLKESQIFDSIRLPLRALISSDRSTISERSAEFPFSEKVDRVNSLNKILDTLQKNWSCYNQDDPRHFKLAVLARDIIGSLNSIRLLLEIALSETENETARNYFGLIETTRKQLFTRVEETLERMHGNDIINVSLINFMEIIGKVQSFLKYMEGFEDIRFKISVKNQIPFFSDAYAISSIIQNLLENAIKYRKHDSSMHEVDLSVYDNSDGVILKVSDNGIGMEEELSSRIFTFGVRDKNTSEEGHGIGLSLVKQLTEQLGGKISMHSVNDKGTSFTLIIPNSKTSSG
jgi:signal transduction histidine kinase